MHQQSQRKTDTKDFIATSDYTAPTEAVNNIALQDLPEISKIVRRQNSLEREREFLEGLALAFQLDKETNIIAKQPDSIFGETPDITTKHIPIISVIFITWNAFCITEIVSSYNYPLFILLFFSWFFPLSFYNTYLEGIKNLNRQVAKILIYNDIRIIPLLVHLSYLDKVKYRQYETYPHLQRFLEDMTKQDAVHFPSQYEKYLCALTNNRHIRLAYPELMQAIIVALHTLYSEETKATLKTLANEKPRRHEEQWIPKAAQSCLESLYNPII
jgi:hypothetical protein